MVQYKGPRLPAGTTVLPEGAEMKWVIVTVYAEESEDVQDLEFESAQDAGLE